MLRSSSPHLVDGKYYMIGGSSCSRYRLSSDYIDTVECYNSDDEYQGDLQAMSDQQLQMYQTKMMMDQNRRSQNANQNRQVMCNTIGTMTLCN